jgi:peptide/nickel transport system permease protein
MAAFLSRRLLWAAAVLAVVWLLTFMLAYVVPGDPARVVAGIRASQADVERIRHALGLDRSLLEQLVLYLERLAGGDFGYSFSQRRPVLELIVQKLPATVQLAAAGLLAQLAIGLPLGIVAALRRRRPLDHVVLAFSSLAAAMPTFWLGYLLLLGLALVPAAHLGFRLFPLGGYGAGDIGHLFLPALTLGIVGSAHYIRLIRTGLLDELSQQYLTVARAKGLTERRAVLRHAVPNALNPVITQVGLDAGLLLSGVVIVERVFAWPGIGKLAVDAVLHGDVPVIMATVLLGTFVVVLANLMADVAQSVLDPRLRMGA